jgi:hypothetical protein
MNAKCGVRSAERKDRRPGDTGREPVRSRNPIFVFASPEARS